MAISDTMRFEVFRRDNHECRYCGTGGSKTNELQIDHNMPRARNGSDDFDNLLVACARCNRGKGSSHPDAAMVAQVQQDAKLWLDAKAATAAHLEEAAENKQANRDHFDAWWRETGGGTRHPGWPNTIDALVAAGLTMPLIRDALDITRSKSHIKDPFLYFCGVAWNKVRALQEAVEIATRGTSSATTPAADDEDDEFQMQSADSLACELLGDLSETEREIEFLEVQATHGADAPTDWVHVEAVKNAFFRRMRDYRRLETALGELLMRIPRDIYTLAAQRAEKDLSEKYGNDFSTARLDALTADYALVDVDSRYLDQLPDDAGDSWRTYAQVAFDARPVDLEGEHIIYRAARIAARTARDAEVGIRSPLNGMCPIPSDGDPGRLCRRPFTYSFSFIDCPDSDPEAGGQCAGDHQACSEHMEMLVDGKFSRPTRTGEGRDVVLIKDFWPLEPRAGC